MDDSKPRKPNSGRKTLTSLSGIESTDALPDEFDPAEEEEGVTLEELSQSYQRMLADVDSSAALSTTAFAGESSGSNSVLPPASLDVALHDAPSHDSGADGDLLSNPVGGTEVQQAAESTTEEDEDSAICPLTPHSIVEAILFVGRPDGASIPAAEIAGLMRGVEASEVATCVDQLNETYAQTNRAIQIVADGVGYRVQLADDVSFIRDRFYGRVRQVKLNQAAIDCLALIAYQPGISREKLEQQRGQASGSLLSQLIRRQLIEMRRVADDKKTLEKPEQKLIQRYYPTNRLLDLTGIESLDDLPQTEDLD